MQCESKSFYTRQVFSDIIPDDWEFLKEILYAYDVFIYIYAALQNFIQLSLTLENLCQIKGDL